MRRISKASVVGLALAFCFLAMTPMGGADALPTSSKAKAMWISKMTEFINKNRKQFRAEDFAQLQRVAASGDHNAFGNLVKAFLGKTFHQAGFACDEHNTRHHCSEHCYLKHRSGFMIEVPRAACAAGCHADNKWFKPAFRAFGKWFEGAKKWVANAARDVKKEFDKAGQWLKTAVQNAGRALKSLGQKMLDGLKKVGKDIAKGALRGPFHLYIEGNRAAYLKRAKPLTAAEKVEMLKFYPRYIVDKVRVVEHPKWTGFFNFGAGATTYDELVIVRTGHRSISILKHELLHVCQYDKYGRKGFAHRYADQYVDSGFNYRNIFFETQAYDFQGKPEAWGPASKLLGYCGKSASVGSTSAPLTARPTKCAPVLCKMYCRCGWAKGADGCSRCACARCGKTTCKRGQRLVRGRCTTTPVRKCRPGYSWLIGKCRKASRPIGSRPIGIRPIGIRPIGIRPIGTVQKKLCRVGSRIHYRDRCQCPRGTKVKTLNRSYRMCVRSGRPPVVTRPRPKASRCPAGSRLIQVRCIRAPCPARCVRSMPRR